MTINAVIPAASFGTRFLPIKKSVLKELLPVLDSPPVIHMVMTEALEPGLTQIAIVTSPGKEILERYSAPNRAMLQTAKRKHDTKLLQKLRAADGLP